MKAFIILFCCFFFAHPLHAEVRAGSLSDLVNYQINRTNMVSAGLPDEAHLRTLKANGVTRVIDLIPGDRSQEREWVNELDLEYYNIPVAWENPTLTDFADYVRYMKSPMQNDGVTLTHCRKNYRGAVFTYLYRVTQLHEPDAIAKQDMLATWQPNETWQNFISEVKAKYRKKDR